MARLISPTELAARLDDPALALLEVAWREDDARFRRRHVPGSRWAHWKALCWHDAERRLPDAATLARRLGALGIDERQTIVLVGDPIQFATYALWTLHLVGRRDVLLLDGGRAGWIAGGFPVEAGPARAAPREHAAWDEPAEEGPTIGREGVLAALGDGALILDLRSPEEYRGERVSPPTEPFDHGAERKGRIPGARHLWYQLLLYDDETLRPVDELRRLLAGAGVVPGADVIAYCRLSHRATLAWFVLTELLGHERVRVYDGSWTEWGSMVGMPVER